MPVMFLRAGEGERAPTTEGREVVIKADLEEVAITESRYAQGESGPDDHVHRRHSDCFWVLDGVLEFTIAGERLQIGAGGFVLVPPNVVHTFRNPGPDEALFLNIHAPACGFAEHLRDRGAPFDSYDPPERGGRSFREAIVRPAGAGEALALLGESELVLKATESEALGSVTVDEGSLTPRFPGVPPHTHRTFVDSFYVLEGTLTIRMGDETVEAGPGDFAIAPPGTVHAISNRSGVPVRYLNVMAPGGFEAFFREVAAGPRDRERIAEIASRYDAEGAA